jgi:hypothetical protein
MYLRTLCERELYLSLFSNNPVQLEKAGIPVPLKSRPGVQLITTSGREFEYEQYNVLCSSLPNNVFAKNSGTAPVDLSEALSKITIPTLILQPQIEPEAFREIALSNIGVAKDDIRYRDSRNYRKFAYSTLASFSRGISGSASFHRVRKS